MAAARTTFRQGLVDSNAATLVDCHGGSDHREQKHRGHTHQHPVFKSGSCLPPDVQAIICLRCGYYMRPGGLKGPGQGRPCGTDGRTSRLVPALALELAPAGAGGAVEKRDEACRGSRAPGKRSARGSVRAAPRHRLHCRSGDVCGAALRAGCPAPGSLFHIRPKTEEKPLVAPISDDRAQQFATALISHRGNQTQAAIACGYKPGNAARCAGRELSRNPRVLRLLQPMLVEHLAALTPRAVKTLAGLLSHKSGYIRLKAAKDILNRNAVGMGREPVGGAPLLIR